MSPREPINRFTARYVVLPTENIDTDQIIPARFLKTTTREGLGPHAFRDWRYRPDGQREVSFALNRPEAEGAEVLVTGRNFGCGSSREHAVWALQGAGFRAVVSSEFADIFRGNALGNGLLPIQVDEAAIGALVRAAGPGAAVTVDLASRTLTLPDGSAALFPVPAFARHCLLHGMDELDFIIGAARQISRYEDAHPPRIATAGA
jgi:3-isopropylmalate/(R)-2-methylmalate dehydratase small subunit